MQQIDATAAALLQYIPTNVPGADLTQNYHNAATTLSTSNSLSLRITQNLSPTVLSVGQARAGAAAPDAAVGAVARFGGPAPGGPATRTLDHAHRPAAVPPNRSDAFNVVPNSAAPREREHRGANLAQHLEGPDEPVDLVPGEPLAQLDIDQFSHVTDAGERRHNYPTGAATDP